MHLQGNLQNVFDALYQLGVIDPVLEMNWQEVVRDAVDYAQRISRAIRVANEFQSDMGRLVVELEKLDEQTLSFLAMEVARELADFRSRKWVH